MNKKGFTLIELLSVIVLIGIVLSIGVLGVSSIRTSILEKQYKNIKIEIELAGEKYYTDTESTQMYVQTLIDEGYLKTDNESKKILDPRNSKELNCHIVNISTTTEKATLDERDSDCNETLEENYAINIRKMDNSVIENKWYKEVFKIKAVKKDTMEELSEYTWTTDLNPNVIETGDIFDLNNLINDRGGAIEDTFYVSAISQSGKVLKSGGTRIKIDTVKPIIEGDIKISNKDTWAKEKAVSITLTDIGSGIKRYIFDSNSSCSSPSDKWTVLEKSQNRVDVNKVFNSNGTFYFCAEDEAGNKIDSQSIIIEKVDATPPECYYEGEMTNYTTGTRNIKYGCYDSESGCQKITLGTNSYDCLVGDCKYFTQNKTYTGTIITASIESTIGKFRVIDKLGNYRDCPVPTKKDLNIYLDNTAPNISITDVNYNGGRLSVISHVTDSNSGVDKVCINQSTSNSSCSWQSCSGGTCTLSTYTTLGNNSYYIHALDKVGNANYKKVSIEQISGTISDSREYSGPYTEYINLNGKVLDYTYSASIGSVDCNSNGRCTVYPENNSYECTKSESPDVSWAEEECNDGGYLFRGVCTGPDEDYDNYTGYCACWPSGAHSGKFEDQYTCRSKIGPNYSTFSEVVYTCPSCSNVYRSYYSFSDLCKAVAANDSRCQGISKEIHVPIVATKTCVFDDYDPDVYCNYRDEILIGDRCYSCSRSSAWFDSYHEVCKYETICPQYDYRFKYTYYVYR